jgi:hypothetical protein
MTSRIQDMKSLLRLDLPPDAHGRTKHTINGAPAPTPRMLIISAAETDSGVYLLYCDENGKEFTDTYHASVDEALKQAEWEFDVSPGSWSSL